MATACKIFLTAFSETKNLNEWVKDTRCIVTLSGLYRRVRNGLNDEEAITILLHEKLRRTWEEKQQLKALHEKEKLKRLEVKKSRTLELQVDRAIKAMGQDLKDETLRNKLRKVTRQHRHKLAKQR